ncbi:MAG: lysozyme [Verrucomicrobiaceae bacterium]|nr:MAG: lysozyme [Verrucomicrobiaceae bacterium]
MFTISTAGISLIKEFEGTRLKAYPDPGTGGAPWTIGVGHTGPEVKPGMVITEAQSDNYLHSDLAKFEKTVNTLVKAAITQPMFDALVSFAYNCGPANLKTSTLLKKVNAGDFAGAANEFAKWNKAAGRVLNGLTRRRAAEAALFRKGF